MTDFIDRRVFIILVLIAGGSIADAHENGTDALERRVKGNALASASGVEIIIEVAESFRHVGGQRFVLRGHTDVEQHFFVVANADGDVDKMYWLQFEAKLPHNEGPYNYSSDGRASVGDFEFATHVRRYSTEPVADSDRGAAYHYLAEQGLSVPTPAIRSRLVHVPEGGGRQELMIVYLERDDASGEVSAEEHAALVSRAIAGLSARRQ
jgi:hypothetical protein